MSSTGRLLDIARRALSAQQLAMDTVGHNIANVNTEGYSRQRVSLTAAQPAATANGFLGQGVTVSSIERVHDEFIESQLQSEHQSLNYWSTRDTYLSQIEGIYNEPSDTGLSSIMSEFWDSWSELATEPDNGSVRENVKQVGSQLCNALNNLYQRFQGLQSDLDEELKVQVSEVNSYLSQIASLNNDIVASENGGSMANEYRDRRDLLLEELSGLADVQTVERDDGQVTVTLGGQILVERNQVYELGYTEVSNGNSVVIVPTWEENGQAIDITSGSMYSVMEARDSDIQNELDNLDAIAVAIATSVNEIHQTGYGTDGTTGNNFFAESTSGAQDIALDSYILSDISKIATSSTGEAGDGSVALSIAQIQEAKIMNNNSITIDDYYASAIGALGIHAQEATNMYENEEAMVQQLENQKASVSGVSLDEEMTLMIQYQYAYQAAAQLITTVDEMIQTIIDMV